MALGSEVQSTVIFVDKWQTGNSKV